MGCAFGDQVQVGVRANKKMKKIQAGQEDDTLVQNLQRVDRTMDARSYKLVSETLKKHFYFFNLSAQEMEEVQKKMFYCTAEKDQYIFKKGDTASCYMILQSGEVVIEEFKKVLKKGDSFGQLALIYNAPRSASAKCLKEVGLWCLSRSSFKQTLSDFAQRCYAIASPYMDRIRLFKFLTNSQKDAIAHSMIMMKYEPGEFIFKQGDAAATFAIVKEGTISIEVDKKQINKIKQGDCFGEQAFYQDSKRSASAVACDKVIILSIHKEDVQRILGAQILKVVRYNINRWAVGNSQVLGLLTSLQIQRIVTEAEFKKLMPGELIVQEGKLCNRLFFATQNTFVNKKGQVVVDKGGLFGQKYLLAANADKKVEETLTAGVEGIIASIPFETIRKQLGKPLEQVLAENKQAQQRIKGVRSKKTDYSGLHIDDLMVIKKLGQGQFGKVFLVKDKQKRLFALKCIQKQQIVQNKMQKITMQQKLILETIQFPFIMNYCRSYKDEYFLYLLLQHVRGAELFDVLREIGLVKKPLARFFIGCVILSIEYLHSNNIIYRDLKPQNMMMQSNGYLRLIDLGTAKRLQANKGFRTFTMIGTPHYMGPEVLQGKGYTFSADLWSIGVMLFEFICGELPYAESLDDPYDIYYEVMKNPVKFPSSCQDQQAIKLIQQLLNKTPENRLGRSYATLKNNSYFDGFDWDALLSRKYPPPYMSELCKKEQENLKKLPEGKPFPQQITKERKGLKKVPPAKWDSEF